MEQNKNKSLTDKNGCLILGASSGVFTAYTVALLLLAALGVFCVQPFIGLADGFFRWDMTKQILESGKVLNETVLSPVIPAMQAVVYGLTNSYGAFTFLQAALFYFEIGRLFCCLVPDSVALSLGPVRVPLWMLLTAGTLCIPTVFTFPLLLTDSALAFVALGEIGLCTLRLGRGKDGRSLLVVPLLLGLVAFSVALRPNTLTVAAGLILLLLLWRGVGLRRKALGAALLALACLCGLLLPQTLLETHHKPQTLGMLWELIATAKSTGDRELEEALGSLGDYQEAADRLIFGYANDLFWDRDPPFPVLRMTQEPAASQITALYLHTLASRPAAFIKTKLSFAARAMGITEPLLNTARGIHLVDDITRSYGALDTPVNQQMRTRFIDVTNRYLFATRPIWAFAATTALALAVYLAGGRRVGKEAWLLLLACFYYGAFLVNTQAHEFRYFAPAFFLLLVVRVACLWRLGGILWRRVVQPGNLPFGRRHSGLGGLHMR